MKKRLAKSSRCAGAGGLVALALLVGGCGGGGDETLPPAGVVFAPAPAAGERGVSEYAVVKIEFDRAMDPATVNTASFLLLNQSLPVAGCVVDYRDVSVTLPVPGVLHAATLTCPVLTPATTYTARVTTAVRDASGVAVLPSDYAWSFTTRSDTGAGLWQALPAPTLTGSAKPAVWTDSQMIVWGGGSGARYDRATNTWLAMSTANAPAARSGHSMVWTGQRVIVWGGRQDLGGGQLGNALDNGGLYDPLTDTWAPLPANAAISARTGHTAVWTGSSMVVWGGYVPVTDTATGLPTFLAQSTGARYSPASGTWQAINSSGAPSARYSHTAVWDLLRDQMIVWGGYGGTGLPADYAELNDGARYNPVTDGWQSMSGAGAPTPRQRHTAVWSGSRMIVWGGSALSTRRASGGVYNPATDIWTPTALVGAPAARDRHAAVWDPVRGEMIVWSGEIGVDAFFGILPRAAGTGGRYNPSADSWSETAFTDAPIPALSALPPAAVWSGDTMLVWAGTVGGSTGARYVP
jgi:hypothetical protein